MLVLRDLPRCRRQQTQRREDVVYICLHTVVDGTQRQAALLTPVCQVCCQVESTLTPRLQNAD